MTYKQKSCPLCGRDMTAIETHLGRGELYCGHCDLTIGGNDAKTPEELIALMDDSEHRRLEVENARLREEVEQWHRLVAGIELPEYPITEFKPKDLERENAKLRELVRVILSDMDAWQMVIASGDTGYGKGCLERLYDLRDQARKLGVEVDE